MSTHDLIRKLTSRKFWLSVAAFVSMLLVALGKDRATAESVAALIMAGASVIGYAIGEGLADAGNGTIMIPDPDGLLKDPEDPAGDAPSIRVYDDCKYFDIQAPGE